MGNTQQELRKKIWNDRIVWGGDWLSKCLSITAKYFLLREVRFVKKDIMWRGGFWEGVYLLLDRGWVIRKRVSRLTRGIDV